MDLDTFNSNVRKCHSYKNDFNTDPPLWGRSQMNTCAVKCKCCSDSFCIKASTALEPKLIDNKLTVMAEITVYTAPLSTAVTHVVACVRCKYKNNVTTIPIDDFTSKKWFICRCGKNQYTKIETSSSDSDVYLVPKSATKETKRRRTKRSKRVEAIGTFHKAIGNVYTPTEPVREQASSSESQRAAAQARAAIAPPQHMTRASAAQITTTNPSASYAHPTTSAAPSSASKENSSYLQSDKARFGVPTYNRYEALNNSTYQENKGTKRPRVETINDASSQQQPKQTPPNSHVPIITIRDEKIINDPASLNKIREVTGATASTMRTERTQIRIAPSSVKAREIILIVIKGCQATRVIAPKPKADRNSAVKIMLKNFTYNEPAEEIIKEVHRCIAIAPTAVKPLNKSGRLHPLIFDCKRSQREILQAFNTTDM